MEHYWKKRTQEDFNKLEEISRGYGKQVLDSMVEKGQIVSYIMMPISCVYDAAVFSSKGAVGLVEFKKRDFSSKTYTTVLFEKKKCESMFKISASAYYYITIFNDSVATVYRFDKIMEAIEKKNIKTQIINCPEPKVGSEITYTKKTCYMLPIENMINI